MKWYQKYKLNWPSPIYVILLAIFPVLFLYAYNIRELDFEQAVVPMVMSLGGAVLLWIILMLILRDGRKAGLGVAIFLLFFFSYGVLYDWLEGLKIIDIKHAYLLPVMLYLCGYCIYFITRIKHDFRFVTVILNIFASFLIIFNLFNVGVFHITNPKLVAEAPANTENTVVLNYDKGLPDIYFIILDEYAHPDTMREWYDYDNNKFIENLEKKGFYVADKSRTACMHTGKAIASYLNMEYINEPPEILYKKIGNNKVINFLRTKGYKWIYFGSWVEIGRWENEIKVNSDLYFNYYKYNNVIMVSEFQEILWRSSMLRPFYYNVTGSQYSDYYRKGVMGTLDNLKNVPDIDGPKFVYAHLMAPHAPFVFGSNGESVPPLYQNDFADKQYYLGQYIFISREIENEIDILIKKSRIAPIIILQSDHGLRPGHPKIVIGPDEWRKIFNALYLPGVDKSLLYESISPVNTFRLIFNQYFNANYPLLPDN